jgi:hypothetical protein
MVITERVPTHEGGLRVGLLGTVAFIGPTTPKRDEDNEEDEEEDEAGRDGDADENDDAGSEEF